MTRYARQQLHLLSLNYSNFIKKESVLIQCRAFLDFLLHEQWKLLRTLDSISLSAFVDNGHLLLNILLAFIVEAKTY